MRCEIQAIGPHEHRFRKLERLLSFLSLGQFSFLPVVDGHLRVLNDAAANFDSVIGSLSLSETNPSGPPQNHGTARTGSSNPAIVLM
jgi:hypothetical protein